MPGTPSRTARVSIARWNLKEAAGKLPVRGTRTASEANGSRARGRIDPKPNGIRIEPAYMWRTRGRKTPRHSVASVEATPDPGPRTGPARSGSATGLDLRYQWARTVVERWRKPYEPRGTDPVLPPFGSHQPTTGIAAFGALESNRRIRNRMSGGVGGRGR